jgi:hypothetical protein
MSIRMPGGRRNSVRYFIDIRFVIRHGLISNTGAGTSEQPISLSCSGDICAIARRLVMVSRQVMRTRITATVVFSANPGGRILDNLRLLRVSL